MGYCMSLLDGAPLPEKIDDLLGLHNMQIIYCTNNIPSAEINRVPFQRHFYEVIALPLRLPALAK